MTIEIADNGPSPDQTTPSRQTLEWHEGDMPYSREFGDHFYCREDGRAECAHVFLAGNGLPERWQEPEMFTIGELGFGTGLNFCETWRQWRLARPARGNLHFISFERFPMQRSEIDKALQRWTEIDTERMELCRLWPQSPSGRIVLEPEDGVRLTVVCGTAIEEIAHDEELFDAWYLDGFAPRRNPDMWSADLMRLVFDRTSPGGTFATYAAAGFVRRNLQAAGFIVERRKGFGSKREMLCGVRAPV